MITLNEHFSLVCVSGGENLNIQISGNMQTFFGYLIFLYEQYKSMTIIFLFSRVKNIPNSKELLTSERLLL
jgi:hypothetical protein